MERLKLKSLCFSEVWFSLISLFSTFAFFLFSLSAHQCPSFASWQGSAVLEFIKLGHSIFHHSLNNLSVSLTSHSQRENLTESQAPDLVPFIRGSSLGWGYQYDCVRCGRGRSLWQKVYVWRLWIASVVGYYLKETSQMLMYLMNHQKILLKYGFRVVGLVDSVCLTSTRWCWSCGLRITLKIAKTVKAVRAGASSERAERRAGGE